MAKCRRKIRELHRLQVFTPSFSERRITSGGGFDIYGIFYGGREGKDKGEEFLFSRAETYKL